MSLNPRYQRQNEFNQLICLAIGGAILLVGWLCGFRP